jgi:hypothetical protein
MGFAKEHNPVGCGGAAAAITLSMIISSSDCLQSIYRNPPIEPYEIIVVDDAPTGAPEPSSLAD